MALYQRLTLMEREELRRLLAAGYSLTSQILALRAIRPLPCLESYAYNRHIPIYPKILHQIRYNKSFVLRTVGLVYRLVPKNDHYNSPGNDQ
jgi:hypothetical protein